MADQPIPAPVVRGRSQVELMSLFLVSPPYSLWVAFRNYTNPWSKNILWFFIIFFGSTFIITGQMDSTRYRDKLVNMSKYQVGSFQDFSQLIYEKETGYVDVVEPFVTFMVSRFTDNGRVLFAVFGLIFGFFYSRNLWYLLSAVDGRLRRQAIPFLLMAAMVVAKRSINGFRFWTATHVFLYGVFAYSSGERLRGVIFSALSLFVHFSFALPVTVLAVYLIIGNRVALLFAVYLASFFVSEVRPEFLRGYVRYVPEVFQERTDTYTSKEYLKARAKKVVRTNWYIQGRITAIRYTMNALLAFIFFFRLKYIRQQPVLLTILSFGLLLFTVANLLSEVPSAGRFQIVASLVIFSFLFLFAQEYRPRAFPSALSLPFLVAAILYITVEIRVGFDTMGVITLIGNPIIALFVNSELPLIDYIK